MNGAEEIARGIELGGLVKVSQELGEAGVAWAVAGIAEEDLRALLVVALVMLGDPRMDVMWEVYG